MFNHHPHLKTMQKYCFLRTWQKTSGRGGAPEVVQKESGLPRFALVPEDVPIDLGVIATRIKVPPHCRIINAALEPLREVLEVAALLA